MTLLEEIRAERRAWEDISARATVLAEKVIEHKLAWVDLLWKVTDYEGHTPGPWEVSGYSLRSENGYHIHWDDNDTSPHPMGP
jgi:hypothetical protein